MRDAIAVLSLLLLVGCADPEGSDPPATAAPAERPAVGEPLPSDCRGETRPVTSGVTAACIARRAIPVGAVLPDGAEWHYTVTFRDSRWRVLIFAPGPRGGGYLVHVDPKTGRILRVQPQTQR